MSDSASVREITERLVKQAGITKKLAAEILRIIPEIIEDGLKRGGEVRVKGLGTFRLKWTREKVGRNPKTGERVEIPAHNRLVFLPEQSFKEYINRDYRLLSYKVIPAAGQEPVEEQALPEPQFPLARRRIHWIVPVAVSVIVILSLIFYLRNCDHSEVGGQQAAVGGQQSAVGSQQSAVGSQQSAVAGQQSAVAGQQADNSKPNSELRTQNSELIILIEGRHLFKLAREVYGNPYLWVLIYKENLGKIPDPDMVISGVEITIPSLKGSPDKLTRNDSNSVSEGYRLVYEFYKAKEDARAEDCFRAMKRYKPN